VIEPYRSDDALLADVAGAERGLWWLGQSGFLLKHEGRHLLLDPYLSDSLTRKYAASATPHERISRRVVDPARLDFVDVVTSSHNHTDHLDAETLTPILDAGAQLLCPAVNRHFAAERLGRAPELTLALGETATVAGFEIRAVPAAHTELAPQYCGYVVRAGATTIYHSGDTLLVDALERPRVDVALLPINGALGNMDAHDAARFAHEMGARVAVPCHYDMFAFNTADPAEFTDACDRLGQPHRVLRLGERMSLPPDR
jgi:L-ascorbate metabolism protein UlaG (beta-lactamase superfamily)